MRVVKLLVLAAATAAIGLVAGTATASPNCPVCQNAYLACVNKAPEDSTHVAACMAQYSTCLSYCGEPPLAAAQRHALLNVGKYGPDLSATSLATATSPRLAPGAP